MIRVFFAGGRLVQQLEKLFGHCHVGVAGAVEHVALALDLQIVASRHPHSRVRPNLGRLEQSR